MDVIWRAGSGDQGLEEMLPAKRKSPLGGVQPAGEAAPAPSPAAVAPASAPSRRPQQRASCGPTCSSPALGWGLRSTAGCADVCDGEQDSGQSARAKALRVCAGAAAAEPGVVSCGVQPLACPHHGSSGSSMHAVSSIPPGMYHSYHSGCCSRLSSSSSLAELDVAAAVAAAAGCTSEPEADTGVLLPAACGSCLLPEVQAAVQPVEQQQQQQQQLLQAQAWMEEDAQACLPSSSGWAEIPDDILKRVLERLQPSKLRVLRLVCRGWEAAACRVLRHMRPEAVVGKQLGRRFPALHSLDLSSCAMGVDFASPRMLRLQSLLRDEHLAELARLSRLEQLSLRGCTRLSGAGLAQLGRLRGSLTMLNLSNCTGLTDECLAALVAAVPQLATLNLQGCKRLGDDGVAHLAAMPRLRHVLLPPRVTDASMPLLVEMPALERVALRSCQVTTAGIYVLLQRPGLKRVVISKCPLVTLVSLAHGGEPNLRVVTEAGLVPPAAAPDAGAALAAGIAPPLELAGQDMQLLVAEV